MAGEEVRFEAEGLAEQDSSSFSSSAIRSRYSSHNTLSSGVCAGHTFGAYHWALITGSSKGS